ncbi:MAG: hypothetical protein ACYDB7_09685 [Mycobacteriales bacterium]
MPLRDRLGVLDRRRISFNLAVPAIVHARLVERFAPKADEAPALAAARRADLLRVPPRAARAHAHWALSASLYTDGGLVRRAVGAVARQPSAVRLLPGRVARYVYDKGPAVLLPVGDYRHLHDLAQHALARPDRTSPLRRGSDLYYLAHGLRYLNQPQHARETLTEASELLVDRRGASDAERYAGILLEQGAIALHQARIDDALAAADGLVNGPGRYAIGGWAGWGRWLAAMAHLYTAAVRDTSPEDAADAAEAEVAEGAAAFHDADHRQGLADLYLVRLLAHRLRLAAGQPNAPPDQPPDLTRRQEHDQHLLLADIALASGDRDTADRHLQEVEQSPANEVAAAWARLGRAETTAAADPEAASRERHLLGADAQSVGATWLAAQAALGDDTIETVTASGATVRRVGDPRVLWLVT